MSDKKGSGKDGGSSDPWTYQCGRCGAEFKTKAELDQVWDSDIQVDPSAQMVSWVALTEIWDVPLPGYSSRLTRQGTPLPNPTYHLTSSPLIL